MTNTARVSIPTKQRNHQLQIYEQEQMELWGETPVAENPDYLSRQLITYIGNKRSVVFLH
ncbi:MAG: hypothetical protein M2R45_05407 [Verrucomicrobia subdivision 3 bacterium]|nr:hypothetical protein [Limisphaerales bacterium]MCS1416746.1 hypothetical protein [Limisphaerales bacterium]